MTDSLPAGNEPILLAFSGGLDTSFLVPWLSATSPYIMISRHGLALWVTSPNLLPALWPKRVSPR